MITSRRVGCFRVIGRAASFVVGLVMCASGVMAEDARNQVLEVTVATQATAPCVTLQWPAGVNSFPSIAYRREKGQTLVGDWVPVPIPAGTVSFQDASTVPGKAYDYHMKAAFFKARVVAGHELPLVENRGSVILLVDQSVAGVLAEELAQWERNAVADGFRVIRHDVARETIPASSTVTTDRAKRLAEVSAVRNVIKNTYLTDPTQDWHLFIVGHVPIPYSGNFGYDGHPDHVGAYPTDCYYADVDGNWTDSAVTNTTGASTRQWNVPGDGKFDVGWLNGYRMELAVGRVDLYGMGGVTAGMTEVDLLRQYLVRDHRYKTRTGAYATVPRRGTVIDNFNGYAVASWMNSISMFGNGVGQSDHMEWFDQTPRLFGHGSGGGSYLSADGIGTSADFIRKNSKAVFCTLFGSYLGDWGFEGRGFIKGPLAGTADSLGLVSYMSPDLILNHMALGDTVGQCLRFSQNLNDEYWVDARMSAYHNVTKYILGDPTLRLHMVEAPEGVRSTPVTGGVRLDWNAVSAQPGAGYHVYRSATSGGPFVRITGVSATASNPMGSPLAATTYTDLSGAAGVAYYYQVKTVIMDQSASGTYANQSLGVGIKAGHGLAVTAPSAPGDLVSSGQAAGGYQLSWRDNASGESGYRVERRNPADGSWQQVAVLGANTTGWTDTTTNAAPVYYRVKAIGSGVDSEPSNVAADHEFAGVLLLPTTVMVDKSAGPVSVPIERFNGGRRTASLGYSTRPLVAANGVDYTAVTGVVNWNHQERGVRTVSIPVANPAGKQLTKVFVLDATPSAELSTAQSNNTAVFVGDASTKHDWQKNLTGTPWWFSSLGSFDWSSKEALEASSIWIQSGYGEHLNGTFGLAARTGSLQAGLKSDSLAMLYRGVSGNFQFTTRVTEMTTEITPGMQVGIVVRSTASGGGDLMRALFLTSKNSLARASRSVVAGEAAYAADPAVNVPFPCWMRMTRAGNVISFFYSADGVTWTASGAPATLSLGTSVTAAMMLGSTGVTSGRMGYARFDNVSFYTTPTAPSGLTAAAGAASGTIQLGWTASSSTAEQYVIERSTTSGSGFVEIARVGSGVLSFTDVGRTAGVAYFYRVKASNTVYQSAYTAEASATPILAAGIAGWRYQQFGTELSIGDASDSADPDADGFNNLTEYATGRSPHLVNEAGFECTGDIKDVAGVRYLTYTFTRSVAATDLVMVVQVTGNLTGPWQDMDPDLAVNQVSVLENFPVSGVRTITVRDNVPCTNGGSRFMRLKISIRP